MDTQTQQPQVTLKDLLTQAYPNLTFTLLPGFDSACLGIVANSEVPRLCYSITAIVQMIQEQQQLDFNEAFNYFNSTVINGISPENTPAWIDDSIVMYQFEQQMAAMQAQITDQLPE